MADGETHHKTWCRSRDGRWNRGRASTVVAVRHGSFPRRVRQRLAGGQGEALLLPLLLSSCCRPDHRASPRAARRHRTRRARRFERLPSTLIETKAIEAVVEAYAGAPPGKEFPLFINSGQQIEPIERAPSAAPWTPQRTREWGFPNRVCQEKKGNKEGNREGRSALNAEQTREKVLCERFLFFLFGNGRQLAHSRVGAAQKGSG